VENDEEVLLLLCRFEGAENDLGRALLLKTGRCGLGGRSGNCTEGSKEFNDEVDDELGTLPPRRGRNEDPRIGGTGGAGCGGASALRSARDDDRFGMRGGADDELSFERVDEPECDEDAGDGGRMHEGDSFVLMTVYGQLCPIKVLFASV